MRYELRRKVDEGIAGNPSFVGRLKLFVEAEVSTSAGKQSLWRCNDPRVLDQAKEHAPNEACDQKTYAAGPSEL